jgi:hypothetical protein
MTEDSRLASGGGRHDSVEGGGKRAQAVRAILFAADRRKELFNSGQQRRTLQD